MLLPCFLQAVTLAGSKLRGCLPDDVAMTDQDKEAWYFIIQPRVQELVEKLYPVRACFAQPGADGKLKCPVHEGEIPQKHHLFLYKGVNIGTTHTNPSRRDWAEEGKMWNENCNKDEFDKTLSVLQGDLSRTETRDPLCRCITYQDACAVYSRRTANFPGFGTLRLWVTRYPSSPPLLLWAEKHARASPGRKSARTRAHTLRVCMSHTCRPLIKTALTFACFFFTCSPRCNM